MKKLKDRWFASAEGIKLHHAVMECLLNNGELSKVQGLAKYSGRWDLRGITTPVDQNLGHSMFHKPFTIKKFNLESVDLSYAVLHESVWDNCSFKDVMFIGTKADYIKFWACKFENATFEKTYLNEALMNATLDNDSGYFMDVNFIESNLKGTTYTNTLFERCNFFRCKLDHVDFNGSRFVDCKFSGKLQEVLFRGNEMVNYKLYPGRKPLPNKMANVDFREAVLYSVIFLDKIDLSKCLFPESDDYIIIRKNRNKIFEEARKVINSHWEDLNKRIGLGLIDQFYLSKRSIDMEMDVVDKHFLLDTDKYFGIEFFNLISDLNKKIND